MAEERIPNSRLQYRSRLVQLEYVYHIAWCIAIFAYGFLRTHQTGLEDDVFARSKSRLDQSWFLDGVFAGVDFSDHQLNAFVKSFPLLTVAFGVFIGVSRYVRANLPQYHVRVMLTMNLLFMFYFHGGHAVTVLALVLLNYAWAQLHHRLPFGLYYGAPWIFHIALLYYASTRKGFRYSDYAPMLAFLDHMGDGSVRWYVIFNMSTLRTIGYMYDVFEAHERGDALRVEQEAKHATCADCVEFKAPCYRLRTASPRPLAEYNVVTYLAYITYVPLYIGGPLSSFNAFASHLQSAQRSFDATKIARYAVRTLCIFLVLLIQVHYCHLNLIREDPLVFSRWKLSDKLLFGLVMLSFLWLKFNVFWKTFRIFAMLDGVESPEDMNRCFANTTLVAEFWRDWHASFNQWIVRYMYVPLGGNKLKSLAIFPIFLFIAIWHDVELHLLWWAGIMCVAFIPELLVGAMFAKHFKWVRRKPYYRHVYAVGGVFSTLSLIVANAFGFGTAMNSSAGAAGLMTHSFEFGMAMFFLFSSNNVALYERTIRREDEQRRRQRLGLPLGE